MEYIASTLNNLIHQTAFFNLTWGNYVMILVACFFLYLAIRPFNGRSGKRAVPR